MKKDIVCATCDNPIEGSGNQKTGRPIQFHKECREMNNAFSLLENRLEAFKAMNPTLDKKNLIRRSLWVLANGSMN